MILLRYLMLETFKSQLGVLFVLLLIFVSQKFIRILAEAINGVIPPDLVMTILYLNLPTLGTLMLPISFSWLFYLPTDACIVKVKWWR